MADNLIDGDSFFFAKDPRLLRAELARPLSQAEGIRYLYNTLRKIADSDSETSADALRKLAADGLSRVDPATLE